MKVLWLCNTVIPGIQNQLGTQSGNVGGWLNETFEKLLCDGQNEYGYCAPYDNCDVMIKVDYKSAKFYGFRRKKKAHVYERRLENIFRNILNDFSPDIVHIFGTEFPHSLTMVRSFKDSSKIVVHIQGLTFYCGGEYRAYLPSKVYYRWTFRDIIRNDNIARQKKKFDKRGKFEIELLQSIKHVMGRTDFDYAAVKSINQDLIYHYCPENLRKEFVDNQQIWNFDNCDHYSIFMSQATYPIKGFHIALKAIREVKKAYPYVKLYVAGTNYYKNNGTFKFLKESSYARYINDLIEELDLEKNIEFVGELSASGMKEYYMRSNVFILPSIMENSPNSLMEAMSLGVPSVASDVGGVSSIMVHKFDGYLYPVDEYYMLAHYIIKVFDDADMTIHISKNAFDYMKQRNDINKNILILTRIYEEILTNNLHGQ